MIEGNKYSYRLMNDTQRFVALVDSRYKLY